MHRLQKPFVAWFYGSLFYNKQCILNTAAKDKRRYTVWMEQEEEEEPMHIVIAICMNFECYHVSKHPETLLCV